MLLTGKCAFAVLSHTKASAVSMLSSLPSPSSHHPPLSRYLSFCLCTLVSLLFPSLPFSLLFSSLPPSPAFAVFFFFFLLMSPQPQSISLFLSITLLNSSSDRSVLLGAAFPILAFLDQ